MTTLPSNASLLEEKQKSSADSSYASASSSPPPTTASPTSTTANLPTFSPALQAALQEVLPSNDPLDSPSFDPIAFINASFPDELSLTGNKLDIFLSSLRKQVKQYNDVITRDVREHSCSRSVTREAIDHATTAITSLFHKIRQIKEKAQESEVMVQEICRDIRSLDHAKKHLTSTIIALRNLHMLVSAVGQLDLMVAEKQYRDAARLIKAIDDLFSLFEQYKHIEKIKQLDVSVNKTKELMKEQLQHEFHRLLPTLQPKAKPKPTNPYDEDVAPPVPDEDEQSHTRQQLADACLLIDVLDTTFKNGIFLWFSSLLLEDYVALYSYGKEGATIDQIDRRYMWCRRMIRNYDDTYLSVFPSDWEMPAYIATQFCKMTKAHIQKILAANPKFDVAVMLKSLTKTIEFERELTYNMKMRRAPEDRGVSLQTRDSTDFDEMDQADLVESIKMKYRTKTGGDNSTNRLDAPRAGDGPGMFGKEGGKEGTGGKKPLPPIEYHGAISDAFTPYMSSYVELERKRMNDLMEKIEREEKWSHPEDSKAKDRYGGSDDLFLYIKNSITQCNKLNRNEILFNLYQEYRRGLTLYADMLERHAAKKDNLSERETIMDCYVVNTGEYCADTIPNLEATIKSSIDASYKEKIDLSGQVDTYSLLINKAVQLLVASVFNSLNRVLSSMQKNNWETWTSVGDESGFVVEMQKILKAELPLIARHLSSRYLPFYCNQLASTFIPKYVDAIYKCKRIGEMGAQQMSLDAHALKSTLLQLPTMGNAAEDDDSGHANPKPLKRTVATKSYTKYVTTEMSKAEALLKTLVSPNERLIVTFKALLPKSSTDDLYRVFALKGLKKQEIGQLIDAYNASVGVEDQVKLVGSTGGSLSGTSTPAAVGKGTNLKSFLTGLGQ